MHRCGNDLDNVDFTPFDMECKFIEPASPRPFTKPILSVTASEFGQGHRYCRICQRPITRKLTEEATVSDTRKGVKVTTLPHQQNTQSNYFSWQDKKEGLTANTELSESRCTGKNKQRGTTGLDSTSSGIGSTDSCSNRPATAFTESEFIPELTAKSTQESKDLDNLSKEASVVIKQIKMCILDLQRDSGNSAPSGNTVSLMHIEGQRELPDMANDCVLKAESNCSIALAKSVVATGSESSQTVSSAICGNDLLNEVQNGKCKDKGLQYQMPSQSTGSPTETGLPYLTASQPLKLLPPKKSMASPVSSQTMGSCTGLAAGQYVPSETGNLSEEIKGQNQMADVVFNQNVNSGVAKIESLKETTSANCQMPTQIDYCNSSWPDENKISKRVPSMGTCFPQQVNEDDLHQNQMVLENYIKSGTCQRPMLSRVSKDYLNRQNIQALDSRCKMNQTWVSQRRKALPWQVNERQPYKPEYFSALFSDSKWMDRNQVGVQNTSDHNCLSRKILPHQDESDDASSNSSSSNWTSQKTSMSNSDSEVYHLPGETQKQNYVSSTTSSENDMYSPRSRSQGHYAGEIDSDIEAYSWSGSDRAYPLTSCSGDERLKCSFPSSANSDQVFSIGDSESDSEDYSMYNQPRVRHYKQPRYLSVGSTSKKFCPTRVYKSYKGMNPSKRIGRWKKLKDKLSIIFLHHHHHHHHHHNHPDDGDPGNNETRMGHGRFWLKHTMKPSHPMRTEAYGEQAFKVPGKSVVHSQDRKKPHNQFNALVGGLFKHIRRSKESKTSAKHIKRFGKGQHEGKKVLEKRHWWQLLQRHRRLRKLGLTYGKR